MQENDLITEVFQQHTPADKGMRFLNYIIDLIVFYILVFCISFVIALSSDGGGYEIETESIGSTLMFNLFFLLVYAVYYGALEALTKGRTIGKFITRTKAVKEDGSDITPADAFKRGFSRAVPFEVFSGFADRPWHDSWTNTMVIKL